MNSPFKTSTQEESSSRIPQRERGMTPLLECRFSQEIYVAIGIWALAGFVAQGAVWFGPRRPDIAELLAMIVVLFHLPCLFFVYWVERIRVQADENGLSFRGLLRTRFVPWSDIEDFGWKLGPSNSKSQGNLAQLFIRGRRKPQQLSRNLSHFDELLEIIAQKATCAPVRSWQPLEVRDEGEWPKTFVYRDVSGWKFVGMYLGFTLTLFVLMFFKAATNGFSSIITTWNGLGPDGKVMFIAFPLMICGLQPLIILARFPAIKAARRFLGQRVIATREGLTFERDGQSTFVPWGDIERFELETLPGNFQLPLGVVHTRRDRYEFHSAIVKGRELRALIAYRATNAASSKWGYAVGGGDDVLGGVHSMWRGGVMGVGARIHHYRTRTNRVMLIFGGLMSAIFIYFAIFGRVVKGVVVPPQLGDYVMFALFLTLLLPPTIWGALAYWYSAVEVDEDGIKQRGIWGERKLRWSEIRSAKFDGYLFTIKGDHATLRLGPVAGLSNLYEEIEQRSGIIIQRNKDFKIDA